MGLKWSRIKTVVILWFVVVSCLGCSYARSHTNYNGGTSYVKQPSFGVPLIWPIVPDRSFAGLRLAGRDTDIVAEFWNEKLGEHGHSVTFEFFEARFQDLVIYDTKAAMAALESFRAWCKRKQLSRLFNKFWKARRFQTG